MILELWILGCFGGRAKSPNRDCNGNGIYDTKRSGMEIKITAIYVKHQDEVCDLL